MLSGGDDGIVVVEGRERHCAMDVEVVPAPLRERLGPAATGGLLHVLELAQREGRAEVIATCTDRFERRLSEEIAGVRVQLAQVEGSLKTEISGMGAAIRQEMAEMNVAIRQEMSQMNVAIRNDMSRMTVAIRSEMAEMNVAIRNDMAGMNVAIRSDMATARVELLKWCFLFWIGQVVAVGTMLGVMLRVLR